jgi:hypothetical protein
MIPPIASAEQTRFAATSTWFFWIATSAAIPIIGALQWVLLQRIFGRHFEAQTTLLSFAILLLAAAPAIVQWAVLRRLVPDLSFAVLVGACWISTIVAYIPWALLSESGFNGERAFDIARLLSAPGAGSSGWLWLKLTLHAAIVALIYNLVPIVVFGWLAKRSWRAFLVTTILGACAAVLLH